MALTAQGKRDPPRSSDSGSPRVLRQRHRRILLRIAIQTAIFGIAANENPRRLERVRHRTNSEIA